MFVFVIAEDGTKLMPTNGRHARRLLKKKEAEIYKYHPFTIRLTRPSEHNIQPIEYCCDTGYQHIGISIKSAKHEYVHTQFDNLSNEKKRHDDCRKYRRTRRNRKRYRKCRFSNRRIPEGWFAPSIQHAEENHERIFNSYCSVCPIDSATFEMGTFDTHALEEYELNGTVLEGKDYQHGAQYGLATLREAVFTRDNYTCQVCGRSVKDDAILHVHHIGFRTHDHSNRIGNLLTVCEKCHTSKNHKSGGKLWDLKPKSSSFAGAAFMNTVRWQMWNNLKAKYPCVAFHMTYGAETKLRRRYWHIAKSHANDAYVMGEFHPKHRSREMHFGKKRRNGRVLSKFYDAKYTDIRDDSKKSGSQLSCNRTNRRESRCSEKNERIFRGRKLSKGRVSVRRKHYFYQPGDVVVYDNKKYSVISTHCNGTRVVLNNRKSVAVSKIRLVKKEGGWHFIPA